MTPYNDFILPPMPEVISAREAREEARRERWRQAPKAAAEVVYCGAIDRFFYSLASFVDYCVDADVAPPALLPWVCEKQQMPAPCLQDLLQNDYEGDSDWHSGEDGDPIFELPDVSDLQAQLDARYAAADLSLWFATPTRFDVLTPEFLALVNAALAAQRARKPEHGQASPPPKRAPARGQVRA